MKLLLTVVAFLTITIAAVFFVINVGPPWIWCAADFSAFGTLLGGVAGPLALVFAVLQFSENKRLEIEGRTEEGRARELGDIQGSIDLTTKRIDALLSKEDINVSVSKDRITLASLEHLLGPTATSLPDNPVPTFSDMEKAVKVELHEEIPIFKSYLLERCAKLAILFNRLRHLCITHDVGTKTNIKCMTYGSEYYWEITALMAKDYKTETWPQSLPEIQRAFDSERNTKA